MENFDTIIAQFNKIAKSFPSVIAIKHGNLQLTYHEVDTQSNLLAYKLLGIAKNEKTYVGVCVERNCKAVIALLAILKAGMAYIPFDPSFPSARIAYMLEQSRPVVVLTDNTTHDLVVLNGCSKLNLDTIELTNTNQTCSLPAISLADDAYILFTSGSTGLPKAIRMHHLPLSNLLKWQIGRFDTRLHANVLQLSTLSFDVSFWEIFSTLCSGSTLVVGDNHLKTDAIGLLRFIQDQQINRIMLPFVTLNLLASIGQNQPEIRLPLREVFSTAEQMKVTSSIKRFFAQLPSCVVENHYGPTESHIVTYYRLPASIEDWPPLPPIGKPIQNAEILLLDDNLKPVREGEEGNLYIGGDCLAKGYLNRKDLTEEKFIEHPFKPGMRLYFSGDKAMLDEKGELIYLGRIDKQLKINGFRVESGEIEIALQNITGVHEAAVTVVEDANGLDKLAAYYTGTQVIATEELRARLAKVLPEYMVPSAFIHLLKLPLTPSGKLDKSALPVLKPQRPDLRTEYVSPLTPLQKTLAGVWHDLFGMEGIGIDDNFFDLGGNSLLSIHLVDRLTQLGIDLGVVKLYQFPTLRQLSSYIESKNDKAWEDLVIKHQADNDGLQHRAGIAIIGMSGRFPGAESVTAFWDNLCKAHESITFFKDEELHFSVSEELKNNPDYIKARGIIKDAETFDAEFFGISPIMAEVMDPQQRKFLEVAWECFEDAGYSPTNARGLIGVYAGVGNNTYYLNNVLKRCDKVELVGDFQAMVLNEKDYIATRTAFLLNLKGPAVSIFTACSTSLAAIAMASESLRLGNCRMALAGGASITSPIHSGYLYNEGGMLASDGHCRPFDAAATGTTFNDGVGCLLLKRYEDALADNDHIYAVIKGVGMSNDGADKASFTAPGVTGQATTIRLAQHNGGIDPNLLGYIEAHGTATPIGDPIEVEALVNACQGMEKQSCFIGSVKSNIGHLTPAAGVAGAIKTALILKHKTIPPTLHFKRPNPNLQLNQTPFKINTELYAFPESKKYAGVSSFGVGGTNVHLVLEQAAERKSNQAQDSVNLFVLSAPNTHNLSEMPQRLAAHLRSQAKINLNDVAFTLLTGRQHFDNRYVAVGSSDSLLETLNGNNGNAFTGKKLEKVHGIVFMFPGQGSQYPGMGKDLYEHEEVFRQWIDDCSSKLLGLLGKDIRELMFAPQSSENEAVLKETQYAQPAIFVFEYSLAKLLISKGVKPVGFIGHSIGEFTAACLSGIFSLDDALKLVATRANLMQAMPKGSMLSVRSSPDELMDYIKNEIELASHNSPFLSVLSGPLEAINKTKIALEANNIPCSLLHTSHAFHSFMMEDVIPAFTKTIESITLSKPRIPIVSTVTGDWLKDAEATATAYWANHLRVPVRFSNAIKTLLRDDYFLLELGPRNTLATLARQHPESNPAVITPCISETEGKNPELFGLCKAIGKIWMVGAELDLNELFAHSQPNRIPLPTYPFSKKRYWIEPPLAPTHRQTLEIEPHISINVSENPMETDTTTQSLKPKLTAMLFDVLEESSGLEINQSDLNASLFELGFDSLILTQLAITLQRKFEVRISFRQLNEDLSTLSHLVNYLKGHIPAAKAKSLFGLQQPAAVSTPTPMALRTAQSIAPDTLEAQLREIKMQLDLVSKTLGISVVVKPEPLLAVPVSTEEMPDIKKPFGAAAKIETNTSAELSKLQQVFIDSLIEQYNAKTAKSKAYTQANRKNLADPRVVTGFRPTTKELTYQIVVERSKGSHMWDIDGNEYMDVLSGFGSNMFGNNPDFITKVLHEQLDKGCELGPQHVLAGEVTQLICEMTGFDRAALCNTGSEAVLGALRMARTVTGRSKVVMFSGSYHGINDEVIVRGSKKLKSFAAAPGIPAEAVANTLVLEYGTDESLKIIQENIHELAAVLVEPVQSRRPDFRPVEFLQKLRTLTQDAGVALIFDEVITGFRAHPKGAQGMFGIKADLATYGKVIGGGMPIGVMAGNERFMDSLDGGHWQFGNDSIPTIGVTYFAGTFVRHPLALAAAKASLQFLKSHNGSIQENLNQATASMATAINTICQQNNWPIEVKYFSSLFKIVYKQDILFSELLFTLMRLKGIHIMDGFPCFATTAHTPSDINQLINVFKESATEMAKAGFFGDTGGAKNLSVPPIEGARLGRAQNGDPAWFIPDPDRPGKYLQIM